MKARFLSKFAWQFLLNAGTIVIVALMLCVFRAWAMPAAQAGPSAVPGVITYQGRLTSANGVPINGAVEMTFRLYSEPVGGTAAWTESHIGGNGVPVNDGVFNVLLGSITPIDIPIWSTAPYLGIQVGTDPEMTPREQVGRVPYAFISERAYALAASDGSPSSAVTVNQFGDLLVSPDNALGGAGLQIFAQQSPASGLELLNTGTPGGRYQMIADESGNLSIVQADASSTDRMTFRPDGSLLINGDVRFSGHIIQGLTLSSIFSVYHYDVGPDTVVKTQMVLASNSMCFLTKVYEHDSYDFNYCSIGQESGFWYLYAFAHEGLSEIMCEARCLSW